MTEQIARDLRESIQEALGQMVRIVHFQKRQQYYRSSMCGKKLWEKLPELVDLLEQCADEINGEEPIFTIEGLFLVLQGVQEAQESEDYVLLSDLYELQFMPILVSIQERLVTALGIYVDEVLLWKNISCCSRTNPQLLHSLLPEKVIRECGEEEGFSDEGIHQITALVEKCFEKGFSVEYTSCGMMTMAVNKGHRYYIHSNGQIVEEALLQAEEWLAQGKEEYLFYGLGMGYSYREMLALDRNISVQVVETNRELLILAMAFAPMYQLFENSSFTLLYDPTGHRMERMALELNEKRGFYILRPALYGVKRTRLREQLEGYFVQESSVRVHGRDLTGNFKKNMEKTSGNIEDLIEKFAGKRVVIAAAGPSLDTNMAELREKGEDIILLAAGTVLKKLLAAEIRPDYVIITDSEETTYPQIQGVEDCGVPLIFLSTVFSWIPRDYQGEKYLLCQRGFRLAEEMAERKRWSLVESGGSVMTTALDMCLQLPVREIIFVGLDLALRDGADHALGTEYCIQTVRDTGIQVPGTVEEWVQTTRTLQSYLQWIEKRLAGRTETEAEIPVIDATEGGAKKKGMEVMTLKEALKK